MIVIDVYDDRHLLLHLVKKVDVGGGSRSNISSNLRVLIGNISTKKKRNIYFEQLVHSQEYRLILYS